MNAYQPLRSSARWLEGAPPYVLACYDSGPNKGADRYTVLYGAPFWTPEYGRRVPYFAASAYPFHPQGFGQHGEMPAANRSALGSKIRWCDLPEDVRKAVERDGRKD